MRIAIFSYEFPPHTAVGGIATYSVQLADMLAAAGHDIEVFVGGPKIQPTRLKSGVLVHAAACLDQLGFDVPAAFAFLQRHTTKPFDLIESPEYQAPALHASRLAPEVAVVVRLHTPTQLISRINTPRRLWRLPVKNILRQTRQILACHLRGNPLPSLHLAHRDLRDSWEIDRREAELARRCDAICSPSLSLLSYPSENWGVPASRCVHLPNMFAPRPDLLELPLPDRGKTLGFLGRLEDRKGIQTLIDTLPVLAARHPDLRVVCVGESRPLMAHKKAASDVLARVCERLNLHLTLPGKVSQAELPSWLGRCRVVMLPSVWENFPYACLEAMSAGCAVVGSKAGGMADIIDPCETGLLASPGQPREFAEAGSALLANEPLALSLGAAAREQIGRRYAPAALLGRYEELYRHALSRRDERLANRPPADDHR